MGMTARRIGAVLVAATVGFGGAAATAGEGKPARPAARGEAKININEASKTELMRLEGVGPGTAEKIITFRQAHGPFKRVQDLLEVDGIGKAVLEKNAQRLTVK